MQSPSPISRPQRLSLVPGEASSAEHVEELLLDAVVVCRRRPAAAWYLEARRADAECPGGVAEKRPGCLQMADAELVALDLVDVGDPHARNLAPGHATGVETASPGGTRAACSGQA